MNNQNQTGEPNKNHRFNRNHIIFLFLPSPLELK
uniref:Uncharacterized protein n=1 Tax=Arundo donax TaxID=35708 RepID=A0A0A9B854_ARUDO